jgi:hypothetical protein
MMRDIANKLQSKTKAKQHIQQPNPNQGRFFLTKTIETGKLAV